MVHKYRALIKIRIKSLQIHFRRASPSVSFKKKNSNKRKKVENKSLFPENTKIALDINGIREKNGLEQVLAGFDLGLTPVFL